MIAQYLAATIAFLACVASLPAIRRVSRKYSLYDAQGPLKIHRGQIPRLGGVAMMVGLAASSIVFVGPVSSERAILVFAVAIVWLVPDRRFEPLINLEP